MAPKAIIEDIWRLINEALLIVADFSGSTKVVPKGETPST
jgi:hypothetical protein